ncbi:cysteine-rich hydrophobic domain-containing protein 2-like [Euwallacea similis]|uniref:cysteine-rich hydrophobic domain-containing protein 2-like n=1 Tax=Euwallacea similis TaxID=1736056 RepID=UPI00344F01C5
MSQLNEVLVRGDGTIVLFGVPNHYRLDLPQKLTSRLAPEEFRFTVRRINKLLDTEIIMNFLFFIMGCFLCPCTAGVTMAPVVLLNKRTRNRVRDLLKAENGRLYHNLGLHWSLAKQNFDLNVEYCLQIEFIVKDPDIGPD